VGTNALFEVKQWVAYVCCVFSLLNCLIIKFLLQQGCWYGLPHHKEDSVLMSKELVEHKGRRRANGLVGGAEGNARGGAAGGDREAARGPAAGACECTE
jgi:hypothetical protein